ncbi:Protein of unknown function [Bacillus mobilis]|nr:Protein of unknown function [Bacillus mobilis]
MSKNDSTNFVLHAKSDQLPLCQTK